MQRDLPKPRDYGKWDKLPDAVGVTETDSRLIDMQTRRNALKEMHESNSTSMHEPGRSWALRQNFEGFTFLNNKIAQRQKELTNDAG